MKQGYHFRSSLFEIEPGEDEDTNPRRYGKQLALWLQTCAPCSPVKLGSSSFPRHSSALASDYSGLDDD